MNLAIKRNNVYRLLEPLSNKRNVVRINLGNSFQHEFCKFLVCWKLAREGKEFVSEAVFKNRKRADVLVLDDAKVIEVLFSEKLKDCKRKVAEYPGFLDFAFIDSSGLDFIGIDEREWLSFVDESLT